MGPSVILGQIVESSLDRSYEVLRGSGHSTASTKCSLDGPDD